MTTAMFHETLSPIRLTVLISGTGTNLQALIDALALPTPPHLSLENTRIVRVISDRKDVEGLNRATRAGIPTTYHNMIAGGYRKRYPHPEGAAKGSSVQAREAFDIDLAELVLADSPDLVICAGFMHVLSPAFLSPLASRSPPPPIINLHPALPGRYNGSKAIERAFEDFKVGKLEANKTGVMIHYVIEAVDMGEVIVVREVEVQGCQKVEDLEDRIHPVEHVLIVQGTAEAIEKVRDEKTTREGG